MKRCRHFGPRFVAVLLIALLPCWSGGCGRRVVYVGGGHKLIELKRGRPAPFDGVLLTKEYLSEIYENLPREADAARR